MVISLFSVHGEVQCLLFAICFFSQILYVMNPAEKMAPALQSQQSLQFHQPIFKYSLQLHQNWMGGKENRKLQEWHVWSKDPICKSWLLSSIVPVANWTKLIGNPPSIKRDILWKSGEVRKARSSENIGHYLNRMVFAFGVALLLLNLPRTGKQPQNEKNVKV